MVFAGLFKQPVQHHLREKGDNEHELQTQSHPPNDRQRLVFCHHHGNQGRGTRQHQIGHFRYSSYAVPYSRETKGVPILPSVSEVKFTLKKLLDILIGIEKELMLY